MAETIDITSIATKIAAAIESTDTMVVMSPDGDVNQTPIFEAVAKANEDNGCLCVKTAEVFITSAQVLQLNTTPITIIPAIAGFGVELLSVSLEVIYNSTAYATNTTLIVGAFGLYQQFEGDLLWVLSSQVVKLIPSLGGGIQSNTPIEVSVETSNPTAGDSDIRVRVVYREVAL